MICLGELLPPQERHVHRALPPTRVTAGFLKIVLLPDHSPCMYAQHAPAVHCANIY